MIVGALLYYQWNGWKNRFLTRLRRMKQPKYLFGGVVGGLYFYWYIFRALGAGRHGRHLSPEYHDLALAAASAFLFVAMLLAWIIPHARAALVFTPGEVAFLFPAPIGRKTLIHFKLLKSQFAILVSAAFMALIGRWGGGNPVLRALGWWVILATINLHLIGCSFARTLLMDRGFSNWQRRIFVLGLVVAGLLALYFSVRNSLPPVPAASERGDLRVLVDYARQVLASGPLPYVLLPFRIVVAPYFASTAGEFLLALGPALVIIALHYGWVMSSDVAFEEASLEISQKVADRRAAMRAGNWQARKPTKAARSPFQLQPTGFPAVALFWKNLASAGSLFNRRLLFGLIWIIVVVGLMTNSSARHANESQIAAFIALGFVVVSLFWAPQVLRNDLRQDLPATDILKMYPLPGWQVVLGELLAPTAILAGAQWLALLVAFFLFPDQLGKFVLTSDLRMGVALAAAIVLPCIDWMAMIIPNAAVLFLPAWFNLGKDSPRGFETSGQQLILMFGQLFVLILSLLPAAAGFALVFFLTMHFLPIGMAVALGGAVAAILLVTEAGFAIWLLGKVFERFDLSGELLQQE